MGVLKMVTEQQPVHITHDTYKRECRYTRGVHIPQEDFMQILNSMHEDSFQFFEFHNVAKKIEPGTMLNGFAGLAKSISTYYSAQNIEIAGLTNGKDFYVKIV